MKNSIKLLVLCTLVLAFFPCASQAEEWAPENILTVYQNQFTVPALGNSLPIIMEVPLVAGQESPLVYEQSSGEFIASELQYKAVPEQNVVYTIESLDSDFGVRGRYDALVDKIPMTSVDFLIPQAGAVGRTSVLLVAPAPVRVNELHLTFGANSTTLPLTVAVYRVDETGAEELVATRSEYESEQINFPYIHDADVPQQLFFTRSVITFPMLEGERWRVEFTYDQLLRLSEITTKPNVVESAVSGLRFLAQPGQTYVVYTNPDQALYTPLRDAGDLTSTAGSEPIFYLVAGPVVPNPLYRQADQDRDGVPDLVDNCPAHSNADQLSSRGNGIGDACDDFDSDRYINTLDNCPYIPNYDQRDTDGDGIGDECDPSESRLTEQHPWLPWLGIGIALLVIVMLFLTTARRPVVSKVATETTPESEG